MGIAALLLWTGCQPDSSRTANEARQQPPAYEISCAPDQECHPSVALLVGGSSSEGPTRCTAALIGERTAVTAAHCLDPAAREQGRCDDVWLGFAETDERDAEWLGCSRVEQTSVDLGTLMAPDYAVLKLRAGTARPALALGHGKLRSGAVLRMIAVTTDRFYDRQHEVRARRCVVDDMESSFPWRPDTPSDVRVLSDCPIRLGNSGAPLIDPQGRMRGLVHAGGPPFFALGLMTESDRIHLR